MVIDKIKNMFSDSTDDRYEVLYYKYSKIKLDNQNLKKKHEKEMQDYKNKLHQELAQELIKTYEDVEDAKSSSFKVKATDADLQRLLMDVTKVERNLKKILTKYSIEDVSSSERMFDPDLHEIASYSEAKGMTKGMIIKTVKKGFKHKGNTIKKPKVVVSR